MSNYFNRYGGIYQQQTLTLTWRDVFINKDDFYNKTELEENELNDELFTQFDLLNNNLYFNWNTSINCVNYTVFYWNNLVKTYTREKEIFDKTSKEYLDLVEEIKVYRIGDLKDEPTTAEKFLSGVQAKTNTINDIMNGYNSYTSANDPLFNFVNRLSKKIFLPYQKDTQEGTPSEGIFYG